MGELAELQSRFIEFLTTGGDGAINALVADQGGTPVDTRLEIYRNAYRLRLRETVDTDHEILGLYLGDELFDQMVNSYIDLHPSHFFSLRDFTTYLPRFLRERAPFSDHPILAEMANFERLLLDVFDAREVTRTTLVELQALEPEKWPALRLRFHPSMQLYTAQWNSVESWRALKHEQQPPAAAEQPDSHWLLWRGLDRLSQFRAISLGERTLIVDALHGEDFAALCEHMAEWLPEDRVSAEMLGLLTGWVEQGMVVRLDT